MLEARGVSALAGASLRKSATSLPGVNAPEPPVMIRQRIAGLFCAVSIASLMPRYMSSVIAFFFSGRRSLITRVAPSSVTIRCPVMKPSFRQAAKGCRWRVFEPYPTSSPRRPKLAAAGFNVDAMTPGPRYAVDGNSQSDRDVRQITRESRLLYRPALHAAVQTDR